VTVSATLLCKRGCNLSRMCVTRLPLAGNTEDGNAAGRTVDFRQGGQGKETREEERRNLSLCSREKREAQGGKN